LIEFVGYIVKKSEEEIREELSRIRAEREGKWYKYGLDGFIVIWRKRYRYRGIPYDIAALKYFSFNEKDPLSARLNKIGIHLVLEYTEEWRDVHVLLDEWNLHSEWLWDDTLWDKMSDWSIEEMESYLHDRAKKDIDFLLDKAVEILESRVNRLKELIKKR